MNRFFVSKDNISHDETTIIINDVEDIKHISKVLRLSKGNEIEICNGNNKEYKAVIKEIYKDKVKCNIIYEIDNNRESDLELVLFQALPKSSKMDLIVQKCIEVGIKKIVPIVTERCVVRIKDEKSENKKIDRWQKIADEAAKQSKRGVLPRVTRIKDFRDLNNDIEEYDLMLIPYEQENIIGIKKVLKSNFKAKKIGIIIGPEGGFEEDEVNKAIDWGAKSVSLGPRILRTETAGIVALSVIMYELGDLGGK